MLSYIAHIPHSPLLLPQISRNKLRQFKKMHRAVAEIALDVYSRGCETVVLLSPYASGSEACVFNVSPQFTVSFGPYGEFLTQAKFLGDLELAYRIRHALGAEYPLAATTRENLDGATGAACLQLGAEEGRYRLLLLHHAQGPTHQLLNFGRRMRDVLEDSSAKIAVVSLGDFARATGPNREQGRSLDQTMLAHLKARDSAALLARLSEEIDAFTLAGIPPLAIALGMLEGQEYQADVLNYEQKYGVGMLAARFV
ncbi:MAG: hypothetical protein HYW81_03350 [Parcubacteria group bacterium]|nr:hypothetical protein [Parcubacteria group bacterium]